MDKKERNSEGKRPPERSGSRALKEQGTSTATAKQDKVRREGAAAGGRQTAVRPGAVLFLQRYSHKHKKYKNTL